MTEGRTSYSRALAAFDPATIVASLSADVVIRVAVGELTVFFRPLVALQLIAEVIGSHMERQFGPREDLP